MPPRILCRAVIESKTLFLAQRRRHCPGESARLDARQVYDRDDRTVGVQLDEDILCAEWHADVNRPCDHCGHTFP